jgi:hypothetical protein
MVPIKNAMLAIKPVRKSRKYAIIKLIPRADPMNNSACFNTGVKVSSILFLYM